MLSDGVERLLVTGDDETLTDFAVALLDTVHGIEQRGRTVFVTLPAEDLDRALGVARRLNLTVQRRVEPATPAESPADYWPVVHQGAAPPWRPAPEGGT